MTRRRIHDYALIARILQEEPALEQNVTALCRRYTELHPHQLRVSKHSMRWILRNHGEEILGRKYRPGRGTRPHRHDYDAIRAIIHADRALIDAPSIVAAIYRQRTGREIHQNYMATMLRMRRGEFLSPPEPALKSDIPSEAK